ncbi:MAG: phosphoribosyl-ATP diphosphatase [Chloroflexota bacterium]
MIHELFKIIEDRKKKPQAGSYTNQLLDAGEDRVTQKFGEEAVELIIAANNQSSQRLVEETADLLYHLLVLLAYKDINLTEIEEELKMRHRDADK